MVKVIFKKTKETAIIPKYNFPGDSGMDVCSVDNCILYPGQSKLIHTGLKCEIPFGYEIQVRPRSGLALKNNITVLNTPGTIDAGYRNEIGIILINLGKEKIEITSGMRIAQLVVAPVVRAEIAETTEELSETDRGEGGFGSTGTK